MPDERGDFVFLLCSERSGSNFIVKLLDAHPEVCGPSPSHLIRTFAPNLWRYGSLASRANWDTLVADVASYLACQLGVWASTWSEADLRRAVSRRSLDELVCEIYRREARLNGKRVVVVKENHAARLAPFLLTSFPAARYLFMVRDPRDMALSMKLAPAAPGGVRAATEIWLADQRENLALLGMLNEPARIQLTRYEDVLADPARELTRICGHLGIEYAASMLEFHEDSLTRVNAGRIDAWRNLARPILRDNAGRYRDGLNDTEIRFVEAHCRHEMGYFGYAVDHDDAGDEIADLADRLARFEHDTVPPGRHELSADEAAIRAERQAVIDRVISRTP